MAWQAQIFLIRVYRCSSVVPVDNRYYLTYLKTKAAEEKVTKEKGSSGVWFGARPQNGRGF
jgi:hypothetical protein